MEDILKEIEFEFDELKKYIEYIEQVQSKIEDPSLLKYINSLEKKRFDYKSLIVSIYGIIEKYCQKIVYTYLELIQEQIHDYDFLSKKLKDNHFVNSLSLASKIHENRYQNLKDLKKEDIITNLDNCTKGKSYKFNLLAFTLLTGNLKHQKICDLFNTIDIDIKTPLSNSTNFNSKLTENAFNFIDDLVERRNEIAHGTQPDELLDSTELIPLIDEIKKYLVEIINIVSQKNKELVIKFKKSLSKEIVHFKRLTGTILAIPKNEGVKLKKGSILILEFNGFDYLFIVPNYQKHKNDYTVKIDININRIKKLYFLEG